jgi:RloB-like protein
VKKNRGYKKGTPFRDPSLFIVACEGAKREPSYFQALKEQYSRLQLLILAPGDADDSPQRSAPHWALERVEKYARQHGISDQDQVWFVLDLDDWAIQHLLEVNNRCKQKDWNLALSNPCSEVWLCSHLENVEHTELALSR